LSGVANAQEENRVLLQRFPVPQESTDCPKLISVSGTAKGLGQVKALLALPESNNPTSSLSQVLTEAHLKTMPEYALTVSQKVGGAYFIPVLSEEQGTISFVLAAEHDGTATAALLRFLSDAGRHLQSVTLSSIDGSERYDLDLTKGETYYTNSLAQKSVASTLACLWDVLLDSMPSFGAFVCSWELIAGECIAAPLECPGVVAGVLDGFACSTGLNFAVNFLTCFGGSDTTPPNITSLSPAEGATVTTPFSVTCQASDNNGIQSISLLFDSTSVATCTGSPCSGSVNITVANTAIQHAVTCTAKDNAGLSAGRSSRVWVNNGSGTPAAPTNLSATAVSSSSIRFSWQDNSNNESGFKVYRWNGSSWQQITTTGANITSYTDGGLQAATAYSYTVCAANSAGSACASNYVSATTLSGSTAPQAPSGLSATALSSTSIRFSWQDNSSNETGFKVYRWNGSSWQQIATAGANTTSYTDSGLQPATTFYYTVCATNSAGSACASNYVSATTLSGSTAPQAPSNLSATALSSSSIRFSWQDNSTNETGFRIYRWNGSSWQQITSVGANVTSYTNSGLASATTYYYTVCAANNAGSACASTYTSATTFR